MSANTAILEKICHLKELAGSSNPNEAAAAAAAADRLIQKYRIDETELHMSKASSDFEAEDSDFVLYETGRRIQWKHTLATTLAAHYGCAMWMDSSYSTGRKRTSYRLVGVKSDMDIVNYMFTWLVSEIEMLTKMFCRGLGHVYSQSYCEGAVTGIRDQLHAMKQESSQKYSGTTALACIDQRLDKSRDAMYKLHTDLKKVTIKSKSRFNRSAYDSGVKAGKKIHLGKVLGSKDTKQLT